MRKVWRDERYTNVKSLREDALAKLAEACRPLSSYTGSVKDLAAGSTEHPDFFGYGIGDTIILVSKSTGIREKQRIVEIDEYENDQDNQVEINNVSKSFAQMQRDNQEIATETAARLANGYTDTQLEDYAAVTALEEVRSQAQAAQNAADAAKDKETGQATTDKNGAVTVALTDAFADAAAGKYRVWLQALGTGEVYVSESNTAGFTVIGTASLTFNWLAIRYTENIDDTGDAGAET